MERAGRFIILILIIIPANLYAQSLQIRGQLSSWLMVRDKAEIGIRYIPETNILKSLDDERSLDAHIAINAHITAPLDSLSKTANNSNAKLYRLWLRYATSQSETRVGLQKINFGPAKILRSLMWFDTLDPQDPFKLTDGVYGMLERYYFLNNSNFWLWGLYGNNERKGLEFMKTDNDHMEYGSRYQFPVYKGEAALSFHKRYVNEADPENTLYSLSDGRENRLAIDGEWDVGIGLWIETSIERIKKNSRNDVVRNSMTIGSDYTWESGIHLLFEHCTQSTIVKTNTDDTSRQKDVSALSVDYLFSILDSIRVIEYYDWDEEKAYAYMSWQHTYDNWQINVIAFSNRENSVTTYNGEGIHCTITYNH
ncbi:MAG: hypothetical protein ACMUIP_16945 [bacterium]